jgi:hypothetical protein
MITVTARAAAPRPYVEMEEKFAAVSDAKLFVNICRQLGYSIQIGAPRKLSESDLYELDSIGVERN